MNDLKFYAGQKVLITGNTGFKGTWLTSMLLHLGAEVVGLSSFDGEINQTFVATGFEKEIKQYKADIRDAGTVEDIIEAEKPRVIFHLAAQSLTLRAMREPVLTFQTNVQGTVNVLEAVRRSDHLCSVIVVTSDKSYENKEWYWSYRESDRLFGADPYGASKSMAENAVRAYHQAFFRHSDNIKVCTVRAGNVFGGGDWSADRLVPDCIRAWSNNGMIEIRSPHACRPWTYVLDVLNGYLQAGINLHEKNGMNGESFNFGPIYLEAITVSDLVTKLWNAYEGSGFPVPMNVVQDDSAKTENIQLKLSSEKAMAVLGWRPVPTFEEAIDETVFWYEQFLKDDRQARAITNLQTSKFFEKITFGA